MIIFDGLYSFISLALTMLSLYINNFIAKKELDKYPFGKYILEPLVISFKSLIIGGMCLYSLIGAIQDVVHGGNTVEYGSALIYSIVSVIGCGGVYIFMKKKGDKISSELIKVEASQWLMDTLLSIGVLVGFVIAMILRNTRFSGLNVYIDPMMVIMVSVVFIKMPVQSFINAFKEILCVKADDEINDDIYLIVKFILSILINTISTPITININNAIPVCLKEINTPVNTPIIKRYFIFLLAAFSSIVLML